MIHFLRGRGNLSGLHRHMRMGREDIPALLLTLRRTEVHPPQPSHLSPSAQCGVTHAADGCGQGPGSKPMVRLTAPAKSSAVGATPVSSHADPLIPRLITYLSLGDRVRHQRIHTPPRRSLVIGFSRPALHLPRSPDRQRRSRLEWSSVMRSVASSADSSPVL